MWLLVEEGLGTPLAFATGRDHKPVVAIAADGITIN
jgi:hypothetical protein